MSTNTLPVIPQPAGLGAPRPIHLPVNADVKCTDGPAGRSKCVVIDPVLQQVTHLVVEAKDYPNHARLVPVDLVRDSTPGQIDLACSLSELATHKLFIETEYRRTSVPSLAYVPSEYVSWPYLPLVPTGEILEIEQVPPGELAVRRGTQVAATDGHVGRVDEFLVNPKNGNITHLVMREGHLWGQKDVTIPVGQIDKIEEDTVHLKLDKLGVEALPTAPVHRWTS